MSNDAAAPKQRILVIDDEPDIRRTLKMTLEYEGYEVLTAGSGNEGLERARSERPDAVLLDIKMPGLDGLEVLERLKAQGSDAEVLIISGHGDISDAVRATKLGAFDFLEKPLEQERLSLCLRNALQQRRLHLARLQNAQDLRLRPRAHVSDLVQEDRPPVRLNELPDLPGRGARE